MGKSKSGKSTKSEKSAGGPGYNSSAKKSKTKGAYDAVAVADDDLDYGDEYDDEMDFEFT